MREVRAEIYFLGMMTRWNCYCKAAENIDLESLQHKYGDILERYPRRMKTQTQSWSFQTKVDSTAFLKVSV